MGREPEFSYRALHQTARPGEARRDIRHAAGRLLPVQVRRALLISRARTSPARLRNAEIGNRHPLEEVRRDDGAGRVVGDVALEIRMGEGLAE